MIIDSHPCAKAKNKGHAPLMETLAFFFNCHPFLFLCLPFRKLHAREGTLINPYDPLINIYFLFFYYMCILSCMDPCMDQILVSILCNFNLDSIRLIHQFATLHKKCFFFFFFCFFYVRHFVILILNFTFSQISQLYWHLQSFFRRINAMLICVVLYEKLLKLQKKKKSKNQKMNN